MQEHCRNALCGKSDFVARYSRYGERVSYERLPVAPGVVLKCLFGNEICGADKLSACLVVSGEKYVYLVHGFMS
jgi:hypothetical protein